MYHHHPIVPFIDPPHLSTVCEELDKVKHKWKSIGLILRVPNYKLREFKKESNPLIEVIDYWLNGNVKDVPVTWRSLVAVLESSSVDERGLAKTIMNKYCPQGNILASMHRGRRR